MFFGVEVGLSMCVVFCKICMKLVNCGYFGYIVELLCELVDS